MAQDIQTIRHAILHHLSEHPHAEDDLQGIAEWWVFENCVRQRVGEVAAVLDDLVEAGLVEVSGGGASKPRYRLADGRLDDIRAASIGTSEGISEPGGQG